MKKIIALIFSILIISSLVILPVMAADQEDLQIYNAEIWDNADLLSDDDEEYLLHEMEALLPYGNVIFSSVTLESGANYEKNAEDTYYAHYGNEPGLIFQIDMGNRKLTLTASTQMDEYIRTERDSIVDNIYTFASAGNYYACASECFYEVHTVINDGKIAHKMKHINNALIALILALVLNFLLVFYTTSRKKDLSKALLAGSVISAVVTGAVVTEGKTTKTYSPVSSSSGGGGGFSGGSSGGGGGGGFSGGSSSHGF